ncbi:MAG: hypothetical protein IPK66_13715 [Rhodospirillales bacterium]|nr:hypothetical protein [Rhodospirillales bacterium]
MCRHRSQLRAGGLAILVSAGLLGAVVVTASEPIVPAPPAGKRPAAEPAVPASAVVEAIARSCNEKRYSDVGDDLHSSLRHIWIDIGYRVADFCEALTKAYTLKSVHIDRQERTGNYAIVFATYLYSDGSETIDRAALLAEKGAWKLAN